MAARLRRVAPALLVGCLLAAGACALLPSPALALGFDADEWLRGLMGGLIGPRIDDINNSIAALSGADGTGDLSNPLKSLFGDTVGTRVYDLASAVMNVLMKPMAGTILAFCLAGQLIKTSQHVNSSATFPGIFEVAGTLVFYAFFSLAIGYSEQVVGLFFEVGAKALATVNAAGSIVGGGGAAGMIDKQAVLDSTTGDTGAAISIWAQFLIVELLLLVAQVVMLFSVWGRAIQIYVMLMFAPVPIALLGADETRHMGVGFLKNLAALCLAAAIMAFVLWLFSIMFSAAIAEVVNTANQLSIVTIAKLAAVCILLCMGLAKSGQWARDVLGG